MALFGKRTSSAGTPADGVWGTALILESIRRPGSGGADSGTDLLQIGWEATAGIPYSFQLEVRPPARDPYRVTIADRVKSSAENAGLLEKGQKIPAGIELPVWIGTKGPDDVKLDWSAYRATPEHKEQIEDASAAEADRNYAIHVLAKQSPKMQAQLKNMGLMGTWIA
jgi:hypothetical protein